METDTERRGDPSNCVTIYADLNCPFCYLLHARVDALRVSPFVDWRGVEHAPEIPAGQYDPPPEWMHELEREVAGVRARADQGLPPEIEIRVPPRRPNSRLAIGIVAVAQRMDRAAAHRLRGRLFQALWTEGHDISSPQLLDSITRELGLGPLADAADLQQADAWTQEFRQGPYDRFPTAVAANGAVMAGAADRRRVELFFRSGLFSTRNSDACAA